MATVRVARERVVECGAVDGNVGAWRWWLSGRGVVAGRGLEGGERW